MGNIRRARGKGGQQKTAEIGKRKRKRGRGITRRGGRVEK